MEGFTLARLATIARTEDFFRDFTITCDEISLGTSLGGTTISGERARRFLVGVIRGNLRVRGLTDSFVKARLEQGVYGDPSLRQDLQALPGLLHRMGTGLPSHSS